MRVLVVIVNYRTGGLTVDCLRSLGPELREGDRVTVVDGASGDDSVEVISKAIEANGWDWCEFIAHDTNGGFAYGNNVAIRLALERSDPPDAVWLLNPDTVVRPGALRELVAFLEAHPRCGIAGGRAVNRDDSVRITAFRFHNVLGELETTLRLGPVSRLLEHKRPGYWPMPDEPMRAEWVSGASMLVRREVFEKVGLLDDGFFMYFEETDFCLRSHQAGFECWYVPSSVILHLVGQSSGVKAGTRRPRPAYWFQSRRRYYLKHHGRLKTLLADVLWLHATPVARVVEKLRREDRLDPPRLWRDFFRHNVPADLGLKR